MSFGQSISKQYKDFSCEITNNRLVYFFLTLIVLGGFAIRVSGIGDNLGFYFDQGRDALVIWDLWKNGKLFLIGPTTGIPGIFRGPLYYYLIAPFYILGKGNPIWPSIFLSFTSILAVLVIYVLGFKFQNRATGLIAATIASFSFHLVEASRWLSNPTPMILISVLIVFTMWLVFQKRKNVWPVIALLLGLSLFHFGSSGEFFYFPAMAVFIYWVLKTQRFDRKNSTLNLKTIIISTLIFGLMALPQIAFDLRHDNILSTNIINFLTNGEKSQLFIDQFVKSRINLYYDVFSRILFDARSRTQSIIFVVSGLFFVATLPKLLKNQGGRILLLLIVSPLIGFLFFKGNYGNIYGYYFTGYFLVFVLLFSMVLGSHWRFWWGKLFVVYFVFTFLQSNLGLIIPRYVNYQLGSNSILLGNQLAAIDWIYQDADGTDFNVDFYVPPVIPYAYEYLFVWLSNTKYHQTITSSKVDLLYTIEEVDPPHPDRVKEWLARQDGIATTLKEEKFGGITVKRKIRL